MFATRYSATSLNRIQHTTVFLQEPSSIRAQHCQSSTAITISQLFHYIWLFTIAQKFNTLQSMIKTNKPIPLPHEPDHQLLSPSHESLQSCAVKILAACLKAVENKHISSLNHFSHYKHIFYHTCMLLWLWGFDLRVVILLWGKSILGESLIFIFTWWYPRKLSWQIH